MSFRKTRKKIGSKYYDFWVGEGSDAGASYVSAKSGSRASGIKEHQVVTEAKAEAKAAGGTATYDKPSGIITTTIPESKPEPEPIVEPVSQAYYQDPVAQQTRPVTEYEAGAIESQPKTLVSTEQVFAEPKIIREQVVDTSPVKKGEYFEDFEEEQADKIGVSQSKPSIVPIKDEEGELVGVQDPMNQKSIFTDSVSQKELDIYEGKKEKYEAQAMELGNIKAQEEYIQDKYFKEETSFQPTSMGTIAVGSELGGGSLVIPKQTIPNTTVVPTKSVVPKTGLMISPTSLIGVSTYESEASKKITALEKQKGDYLTKYYPIDTKGMSVGFDKVSKDITIPKTSSTKEAYGLTQKGIPEARTFTQGYSSAVSLLTGKEGDYERSKTLLTEQRTKSALTAGTTITPESKTTGMIYDKLQTQVFKAEGKGLGRDVVEFGAMAALPIAGGLAMKKVLTASAAGTRVPVITRGTEFLASKGGQRTMSTLYKGGESLNVGIGAYQIKKGNIDEGMNRISGTATRVAGFTSGVQMFKSGAYPKYENIKLQTKKGDVSVYKGITYEEQPLIGISQGKLGVGYKSITPKTMDKIYTTKFTPESKVQSRYVLEVAEAKYSPTEVKKIKYDLDVLGEVGYQESAFTRDEFTRNIKSLKPKAAEKVYDFGMKEKGLFYGSATAEAQMPKISRVVELKTTTRYSPKYLGDKWVEISRLEKSPLGIGRGIPKNEPVVGDIDIQLPVKQEVAILKAQTLLKQIRATGMKARISEKTPTLIETKVEGKWRHAVDIHSIDQPLDPDLPLEGAWGYRFNQPTIKIEGKQSMPLSEFSVRKSASILTMRPKGVAPEAHRMKDISDSLVSKEWLLQSKLIKTPSSKVSVGKAQASLEKLKGIYLKEGKIPKTYSSRLLLSSPSSSISFGTFSPPIVPTISPSTYTYTKSTSLSSPSVSVSTPTFTSPSISPLISPSLSSASTKTSVSPRPSRSLPSLAPSPSRSISPRPKSSVSPKSMRPSPSISPSISPSVSTSLSPSISPSISPSLSPSISPSISPSLSPSISPSVSPSPSPSQSPSPSPSPFPSPSPLWGFPSLIYPQDKPKKKAKKVKGKRGYTPSIEAIMFDIKGKRPPSMQFRSGLTMRPL